MAPDTIESAPIYSTLAGEADMHDLIDMFVHELPGRALAIEGKLTQRDNAGARSLAHQLKGAAGGYGFACISDAAAVLEGSLKSDAAQTVVLKQAAALSDLCRRARAGAPHA